MSQIGQDEKDKEIETLRRENEMLKNESTQLKGQLQEATDSFKDFTGKERVREEAERKDIIDTLDRATEGKIGKDILEKMSLGELYVAKMTWDKTHSKSFASIIAAQDAESKRPKPATLTVGAWDSDKKQWIGGV